MPARLTPVISSCSDDNSKAPGMTWCSRSWAKSCEHVTFSQKHKRALKVSGVLKKITLSSKAKMTYVPFPAEIVTCTSRKRGPGSSVGTATDYGLDGPGIESRWGRDYPPSRPALGPTPASCTMGTGSFPGVESGRGVTLNPHPLLVPRSKNRVEL